MLRINAITSASGATRYYNDGLEKSDYYAEKGEIIGNWYGKGAERLNLSGEVQKSDFEKLCYNIDPNTNEQLTARNNSGRRVGYDFTFSVPKSISIAYAITEDKEILSAFRSAVHATMSHAEEDVNTRVRIGGKREDRNTGNMLYGEYIHSTARPVDGVPDCHLHAHCFAFNATYDKEENRWKAIELGKVKSDGQYYETYFHSELANNLEQAGFAIERNKRDFELAGFDRNIVDKFSRRTLEIDHEAEKLGIETDGLKSELGAKTRAHKRTGMPYAELRQEWMDRLSEDELNSVLYAKKSSDAVEKKKEDRQFEAKTDKRESPKEDINYIDYALNHALERKSVVEEKELLVLAAKRSYGQTTVPELKKELEQKQGLITQTTKEGKFFTTKEALAEEKKLVQSTRKGRNQFVGINPSYQIENEKMSNEQRQAVQHGLSSKDQITIITGGAGTGKTWSVKEIAKGVEQAGIGFHAFAPSAAASRDVQRKDGFEGATTIADLLQNEKQQNKIKDGVMWIDEAGMVGNKTMNSIIDLANKQNARILLTGDIKQHGAVERGDALRIIQEYGGVKPAYITKIQRQQKWDYKTAVKAISEGKMDKGFEQLEQMGAIKENVAFQDSVSQLSKEYAQATKNKESVLLVATTHQQGKEATKGIREELKKEELIKGKEHSFEVQQNLSYTNEQKKDAVNYEEGMAIQFHLGAKGITRGAKYDVVGKDKEGNVLVLPTVSDKSNMPKTNKASEKKKEEIKKPESSQPQPQILPLEHSERFSVYQKSKIQLAEGDKIRITQNGFSKAKKRLNNGKILSVKGFDDKGDIIASTGKNNVTIPKDYRNLTHGFYTTSPASQGKSVNRVLVLQDTRSGKAANKEQFYVSASRGKFAISVYTDDKKQLLYRSKQSSHRMTATEMAKNQIQPSVQKTKDKATQIRDQRSKLQTIGAIYKTGLSKLSSAWNKTKDMLRFNSKPIQPKGNVGRTK